MGLMRSAAAVLPLLSRFDRGTESWIVMALVHCGLSIYTWLTHWPRLNLAGAYARL